MLSVQDPHPEFAEVIPVLRHFRNLTTVSGLMTPKNYRDERSRIIAELDRGKIIAPVFEYKDVGSKVAEATYAAGELLRSLEALPAAWAEVIEKDTRRRLRYLEAVVTHEANRIDTHTREDYGIPSSSLLTLSTQLVAEPVATDEPTITRDEVRGIFAEVLKEPAFEGWSVRFVDNMYARVSVAGGARELKLKARAEFTRSEVQRLAVHELGTHALRRINAEAQGVDILAMPIGVPEPSEEGLAVFNEELLGHLSQAELRRYALRVLAAEQARTGSFTDTLEMLISHTDVESSVDIALRAKRGIIDPEKAGGHFKDISYLAGYLEVRDHLRSHPDDYHLLMSVKQPMEMLSLLKSIQIKEWPVPDLDLRLPGPHIKNIGGGPDRYPHPSDSWRIRQNHSHTVGSETAAIILAESNVQARRSKRIEGLRIKGDIDLEGIDSRMTIEFVNCQIEGVVRARNVTIPGLIFRECTVAGIDLSNSTIDGDLLLINSVVGSGVGAAVLATRVHIRGVLNGGVVEGNPPSRFQGELDLDLALIEGRLDLNSAVLEGSEKRRASGRTERTALSLTRARCTGGIRLRGAQVSGAVRAIGLTVEGQLNLVSTTLSNPDSYALVLERAQCSSSLLGRDLHIEGGMKLTGSDFGGSLIFPGLQVQHDPSAVALKMDKITCESLTLSSQKDGATTEISGQVNLDSAHIMRNFRAERIRVVAEKVALVLDGLTLGGRMSAARMDLLIKDTSDSETATLCARGFSVARDVDLRGLSITGNMKLSTMRIGHYFSLQDLDLKTTDSIVSFQGSTIGHDLNMQNSCYGEGSEVDFTGVNIAGSLIWKSVKGKPDVDLDSAFVHELDDDFDSWPESGALSLAGFSYDQFGESSRASLGVNERIEWISRQRTFSSGPYERLALFYQASLNSSDERCVMLALQKAKIRNIDSRLRRWVSWVWYVLTGNGYRLNGIILLAALILTLSVSSAFWARSNELLIPGDPGSARSMATGELVSVTTCTRDYPCFAPFMYGVDAVVPVVEFYHSQYWVPDRSTRAGQTYDVLLQFYTLLGWITLSISAGGVVQRIRA
ncbi:DUF1704 domain-containing protein [Corynebacterium sp. YIM 101645]|uniref:DUF1704 domain-containing protein n=1 Tax=Corynebacterium lemuris TaxID=1859292 RepID=A0ABT2FVQ9_9CORY|nr:tyrosine/phenylalanine carboxypeptidase domain-containing protein [Corynebacterium lemuris]MCS5479049.1 DUF1704 domain-containing protein [Corynebacterium lemuris]